MRLLGVLLLLMFTVVPALAQDATPEATPETTPDAVSCQIDLTDALLALAQAQVGARDADTGIALSQIAVAQDELQAIVDACAGIPAVFNAPNGTFSVEFPAVWRVVNFQAVEQGGLLRIGNSEAAAQQLDSATPRLISGQQAVQVIVTAPPQDAPDGLAAVTQQFEGVVTEQFGNRSETSPTTIDGRAANRLTFSGEQFEATLLVIDLNSGLYGVVIGVSAPNEGEALNQILEQIAASLTGFGNFAP